MVRLRSNGKVDNSQQYRFTQGNEANLSGVIYTSDGFVVHVSSQRIRCSINDF